MSEPTDLQKFCDAYLKWIADGCPQDEPFDQRFGLCINLSLFDESTEVSRRIYDQMREAFKREGLDPVYPFNVDTYHYLKENDRTKNPARIAWVKAHSSNPDV